MDNEELMSCRVVKVSSLNVHSIDLSHNEFTSGFVLSHSLLSFCPQLLELSISNLEIQGGEDDLITAICGWFCAFVTLPTVAVFCRGGTSKLC